MNFEEMNNYINNLYRESEEINRSRFIEKTKLKEFIPVVDDDVARMLKIIIQIARPMNILEIGTSIGYSAVSMAQIVKEYGGKITTIEFDETVAAQAKENFIAAGVDKFIDIKMGDAREIIPNLSEKYDMIFQDVDKKLYPVLLDSCIRALKSGGILVAEDTLFPVLDLDEKWHDLIAPIEEFDKLVISSKELNSTLLPIGDGLIIAVKQ